MPIYKESGVLAKAEEEFTPEYLARLGRAIAGLAGRGSTVLAGHRPGAGRSEAEKALAEGLAAGGCVVADVGGAPRVLLDFGRRMLRAHSGVYVDGGTPDWPCSVQVFVHNLPAGRAQMEAVRRTMESDELPEGDGGEIEPWEEDIAEEYIRWLQGSVPQMPAKGTLKALALAPEGVLAEAARRAGEARPLLDLEVAAQESPVEIPWTGGAPSELDALGRQAKEAGAAFGALIDATGTKARFVDEKGKVLCPDTFGLILLKKLFADIKEKKVVLDVRMSQELVNEVKARGGQAVFARPGEAAMLGQMAADSAVLGLGADGAVFFPEIQGADAIYMLLRVAEMLRASGDALSKLRLDQKIGAVIGDVVVPCKAEWFHPILSRIRSNHPLERQVELNGVRVRLDEGWAVALPLEEEERILYRFGGKDQETVAAIAAEFADSAVEIRSEARRLAGLPPPPQREETYEDYERGF